MKITLERIIILALALTLAFSLFKCESNRKEAKKEISQLILDKQTSDSLVNVNNQKIVTQEAILTKNKEALSSLTDSIFALTKKQERKIKDVIAYYKGITSTQIRDVDVPYIDTIAMKKWEDSIKASCSEVIEYYETNTISVPRTAVDSTPSYHIALTINKDNIHVDDIQVIDTQYIRFVTLKGGPLRRDIEGKFHLWLKKRVQVQVLHTNQDNVTILGQNSAIYTPPSNTPGKIIERIGWIGIGAIGSKILW